MGNSNVVSRKKRKKQATPLCIIYEQKRNSADLISVIWSQFRKLSNNSNYCEDNNLEHSID